MTITTTAKMKIHIKESELVRLPMKERIRFAMMMNDNG
jgi:hypothetical protein